MIRAKIKIGIIGAGPSGMFVYKRLVEWGCAEVAVEIFESAQQLGAGMPYSAAGANVEHVTNVSSNEIPTLVTPLAEWIDTLDENLLKEFRFQNDKLTEYRVFPRLLFGKYLADQFALLRQQAAVASMRTVVRLGAAVMDIVEQPGTDKFNIVCRDQIFSGFDFVIISTGHLWPRKHEQVIPGYFDSPYPPAKLRGLRNHPVAIRGSSLTAIDAVRTLARSHGTFSENAQGKITFHPREDAPAFKMVLHSRSGLLPAIRFHLDDPHLSKDSILSREELARHMAGNDGFLSLDYIFDQDFKEAFREKDPAFFDFIRPLTIEEFVSAMMKLRENVEPFALFKMEYAEAKESIRRKESIYWKEMLAVLSFALNYPAKHLSAEDMMRLQNTLMPLISVVIAFAPQRSCEELIALHDAGGLDLVAVGSESQVEANPEGGIIYRRQDEAGQSLATKYETYVDCVGQPHLELEDFPFPSLIKSGFVTKAKLRFRSRDKALREQADENNLVETADGEDFYLKVPGLAINDQFQTLKTNGESHDRLYIMAVPFIGGYNPDYSGLDFCEEASRLIVDSIRKQVATN